jgi:hypothetical protein
VSLHIIILRTNISGWIVIEKGRISLTVLHRLSSKSDSNIEGFHSDEDSYCGVNDCGYVQPRIRNVLRPSS